MGHSFKKYLFNKFYIKIHNGTLLTFLMKYKKYMQIPFII